MLIIMYTMMLRLVPQAYMNNDCTYINLISKYFRLLSTVFWDCINILFPLYSTLRNNNKSLSFNSFWTDFALSWKKLEIVNSKILQCLFSKVSDLYFCNDYYKNNKLYVFKLFLAFTKENNLPLYFNRKKSKFIIC